MLALAEPLICPPLCPHCGIDLAKRADVEIGDLRASLYGDTYWKGERIALTAREAEIVLTLARSAGRYIQRHAIDNIIGHDGDSNVVSVTIHRIRAKFREIDTAFDRIESRLSFGESGYRWNA